MFDAIRISNVSYIGQTTCNLNKRIAQHRGVSERTGKIRKSAVQSSIRDHCLKKHNEPPEEANFRIIDKAKTKQDLGILEAIHITFQKPCLNKQLVHDNLLTL